MYLYQIKKMKLKTIITTLCLITSTIWFVNAWYYSEYDNNIEQTFKYVDELKYSPEYVNAYNYALKNWITTIDSIINANLNWEITRIEMAKMISTYAINIAWLKPDNNKDCNFSDVSRELDVQFKYWVTRACQLWLMWLDNDWNKQENFNPRKKVTRAQLATVLSRMLNRSYWRTIKNWEPYYDTHLKYLIQEWIINDYYKPLPDTNEKRWNVMLMLYRSDYRNIVTTNYEEWYTILKPWQLYRNKHYWIQVISSAISWWVVSITKNIEEWDALISLFAFLTEEIDWYKLDNTYWKYEEYKDNAKRFNSTWLLLNYTSRLIEKKNSNNTQWIRNTVNKDYTEKDYQLIDMPWFGIQESPFTARKDEGSCPICWPMWYYANYKIKNIKWDIEF